MKADPAVQRRLLDLSEVDKQLAQVAHRRGHLPELAEIEKLDKDARAKRDDMVAVETALGDLDRDVKRLEAEVDQVRAREDRDRGLLAGGSLGAKQLTDLEHELHTLERRQSILEDELLEVMERREASESDVKRSRDALAVVQDALTDAIARRDRELGDLDVTSTRRAEDRARLAAELPADLVALYDRVRTRGGAGAALLRARRCGGCQLELDRTAVGALRTAAADDIVRCEECGAILVRTSESGL